MALSWSHRRPRGRLAAVLACVLSVVPLLLPAGQGPAYRYGEYWWREYLSDPQTLLLLHFGPPQESAAQKLATKLDAERNNPLTGTGLPDDAPVAPVKVDLTDMKGKPVDDRQVPAGTVLDYSDARASFKVSPGVELTPEGRFGAGLRCTGSGALLCAPVKLTPAGISMECWFKVADYPKTASCLLAINNDEGRVLLQPDGRVELVLKQPHGLISPKLTPGQRAGIEARPCRLLAPDPVPLGEWTHVVAYTFFPVVQGGGQPFEARLQVNGEDVAHYLSERDNDYNFMGRGSVRLVVGNDTAGKAGFTGVIDEVRLLANAREFYPRPPMPWRDAALARPLQFDRPAFLEDGTVFHASCDQGLKLDRDRAGAGPIQLDLHGAPPATIEVDGIRGKGWLLDPAIGFPRIPLKGMSASEGSLECWLRPVNWDNYTGYWSHSPPLQPRLSVIRFYGTPAGGGKPWIFLELALPRAYDLEHERAPIHPGQWNHYAITWAKNAKWASVYLNGKVFHGIKCLTPEVLAGITPTYVEFGITDDVTVMRDEQPKVELDEVVGYSYHLTGEEVAQAYARWQGPLTPIRLCELGVSYKFSIAKLEASVTPRLPRGVVPAKVRLIFASAKAPQTPLYGPLEAVPQDGAAHFVLSTGQPLTPGAYVARAEVLTADGQVAASVEQPWTFTPEDWRDNRAGILDHTPAPWTPVQLSKELVSTRMTQYRLGADGLPTQIIADGENLLAAPVQLLEDGQPLAGQLSEMSPSHDVDGTWRAQFSGKTVKVELQCRVEYDGLVRYELHLQPAGTGPVGRLALVFPLQAAHATRYLYVPSNAQETSTGEVPAADGTFFTARHPAFWLAEWQAKRKKEEAPTWATWQAYAFCTQLDLNDRSRGLYWFADNAAGWQQSKTVPSQEITRKGGVVTLTCNLVAEPVTLAAAPAPIVFGILPHPARPLPTKYRLFERADGKSEPLVSNMFDAFVPWSPDPRGGGSLCMKVYPPPDPEIRGSTTPSYDYAQRCGQLMKLARPSGARTMYLSRYWFSCRAGAYDWWEWRNGPTHQATLTPSFVNYLCSEMDQWIGRDVWDAVYLDECYNNPSLCVEAGQAVTLPDGTVQPGDLLWGFRDLMKRWRGIFIQHGKEPLLMAHHTGSFQYCALVFCDATLDGENRPIVSATSKDFIDAVPLHRAEAIQNARLWGVAPFYMVAVWEKGFENKEANPHKRWAWRMARGANALLAQMECNHTYPGQGAAVYQAYSADLLRWGAGASTVPFHPYWEAAPYLTVDGQGKEVLVGCYTQPGKVLLLASNLTGKPRELRITLNRKTLALSATAKATDYDSAYTPAAGDDLISKEDLAKVTADVTPDHLNAGKDTDGADLMDAAIRDSNAPDTRPRLEGDVLIIPVRAKDYRLISIE